MTIIVDSKTFTCCKAGCGIVFAVPAWFESSRREDHQLWYCPNGHGQQFTSESDAEKFRRERDIAKQQNARLEEEARQERARAEKAEQAVRNLKKRTSAGTCPCCQRSFSNMAVHIRKQHPQFLAEQVVPLKAVK